MKGLIFIWLFLAFTLFVYLNEDPNIYLSPGQNVYFWIIVSLLVIALLVVTVLIIKNSIHEKREADKGINEEN